MDSAISDSTSTSPPRPARATEWSKESSVCWRCHLPDLPCTLLDSPASPLNEPSSSHMNGDPHTSDPSDPPDPVNSSDPAHLSINLHSSAPAHSPQSVHPSRPRFPCRKCRIQPDGPGYLRCRSDNITDEVRGQVSCLNGVGLGSGNWFLKGVEGWHYRVCVTYRVEDRGCVVRDWKVGTFVLLFFRQSVLKSSVLLSDVSFFNLCKTNSMLSSNTMQNMRCPSS